jgi:hypothetical protein
MLHLGADFSFSYIKDPNIWSIIYARREKYTEIRIGACLLDVLGNHGRHLPESDKSATSFNNTNSDRRNHGLERVWAYIFSKPINL